jgi:hypothetical protein
VANLKEFRQNLPYSATVLSPDFERVGEFVQELADSHGEKRTEIRGDRTQHVPPHAYAVLLAFPNPLYEPNQPDETEGSRRDARNQTNDVRPPTRFFIATDK